MTKPKKQRVAVAKKQRPAQPQRRQPGIEKKLRPRPQAEDAHYVGASKLAGKVALISGGDSGIGRAVALAFAKEGADVAILYLDEHADAEETQERVRAIGRRCVAIAGDVGDAGFCARAVARAVRELGALEVLVNNAAEQHETESIADLDDAQMERTFGTNVLPHQGRAPHLREGAPSSTRPR